MQGVKRTYPAARIIKPTVKRCKGITTTVAGLKGKRKH